MKTWKTNVGPILAMGEKLVYRKKYWMNKNKKWFSKWNIKPHECPNTKEKKKYSIIETFGITMWTNHSGHKKILHQRV